MLDALVHADAVTLIGIVVKALAYAASLLAMGSVLVFCFLPGLSDDGRQLLRRIAILSALTAALVSALRLPLQASFLMGGTVQGAFDPLMLGLVLQSPLGESVVVRLAGMVLICCLAWRAAPGQWLALIGALLVAASFALRGHTLGEPRFALAALVVLHILCLAYWVGALAPLMRAAMVEPRVQAGALASSFGRQALWLVLALTLAGGAMLFLLGMTSWSALAQGYGQGVALKLVLFAVVLGFAGVNKLILTPALRADTPGAGRRLRRSILLEAAVILAILLVTATFTSLSSPPVLAQA